MCHARLLCNIRCQVKLAGCKFCPSFYWPLMPAQHFLPVIPIILMRSHVTFTSIKFLMRLGMRLLTFLRRCFTSEPLLQLCGESCSSQVPLFLQHMDVNSARKTCWVCLNWKTTIALQSSRSVCVFHAPAGCLQHICNVLEYSCLFCFLFFFLEIYKHHTGQQMQIIPEPPWLLGWVTAVLFLRDCNTSDHLCVITVM